MNWSPNEVTAPDDASPVSLQPERRVRGTGEFFHLRQTSPVMRVRVGLFLVLLLASKAVAQLQDFSYTNNNGTITITSYTGPAGEVTVPSTIDGLPVVRIGNGNGGSFDFYGTNVTSVILPNSVIDIAAGAFGGCYTLTNVTLGQNVATIGNYAFNGCPLSSVQIPGCVMFIAGSAFFGCYSLKAITVGSSNPMYSSLDGVLFNKNQTTLLQCPLAKAGSYSIPGGVSIIASNAFTACIGLTTVTIPDSVGVIEPFAFQYAEVSTIVFGQGVTNIGVGAFYGSGLTNVTIPLGISSVSDSTFSGCSRLTEAFLPDTVTRIGTNAFVDCWALTTVRLGSGLTNIGDGAFSSCFSLIDVRIPNNVTTIGASAFYSSSLTSVVIPNSVTRMGASAFEGCTNLTNATIGEGITNVARTIFIRCQNLVSATLGSQVSYINDGVFVFCTSLRSVYCKGNAPGTFPELPYPGIFGLDNGLPTNVTVYYLPKTTGWHSTFAGVPTALWNPQMQASDAGFGVHLNRFGFNVTGTANIPLVIEASTEVRNGSWLALQTCTLTNGLIYFSDPQWTNYPSRLYRIRSP